MELSFSMALAEETSKVFLIISCNTYCYRVTGASHISCGLFMKYNGTCLVFVNVTYSVESKISSFHLNNAVNSLPIV